MPAYNAPLSVQSTLPAGVANAYATASKFGSTGLVTHTWDTNADDWTAVGSLTIADAKFPLVQETTWTSSYQVAIGTLGGYTGPVLLRLHDDSDDSIFDSQVVHISAGYVVSDKAASVSLDPVPAIRTWHLSNRGTGLEGACVRQIQAGESKVYAMDFRDDLRTGIRLASIGVVEVETPSADLTFTPVGVDAYQAKFLITVVASPTAGEHTVRCKVTYSNGDAVEGDGRLLGEYIMDKKRRQQNPPIPQSKLWFCSGCLRPGEPYWCALCHAEICKRCDKGYNCCDYCFHYFTEEQLIGYMSRTYGPRQ